MKVTVEALLEQLFYDSSHPLVVDVEQWLQRSKRFREFCAQNVTKIRSKLRNTVEPEILPDLAFELETAVWLLNDKRFSLTYEEHGVRTRRGPDFVVTFTTRLSFGVEVTRLQFPTSANSELSESERYAWRIANTVATKLGQMNAEMGNLLILGIVAEELQSVDLDATMRHFRRRAQEKDELLLARSELGSTSAFFKHFQRLSAVMLRALPESERAAAPILWANNETRHPFPSPILTALKDNL